MNQTQEMMPMVRVTQVREPKGEPSGLKAFVDVVIAEHFAVKGIRVMEGPKGLFVSMPGRKAQSGEFVETFHPITKDGRELLHGVVKAAFKFGKGGKKEVLQ